MARFVTVGSYTPNYWQYEPDHRIDIGVTVVAGQGELLSGTVMGKITASGKYAKYNNAAVDGSEVAVGILVTAVDATNADQEAAIRIHGAAIKDKLIGLDAAAETDLAGKIFFV